MMGKANGFFRLYFYLKQETAEKEEEKVEEDAKIDA